MALVTCPECGMEFSDKVVACPECGCPTSEVIASIPAGSLRTQPRQPDQSNAILWAQRIIYIAAAICCFLPWWAFNVHVESHVSASGNYQGGSFVAGGTSNFAPGMMCATGWGVVLLVAIGLFGSFGTPSKNTKTLHIVLSIIMGVILFTFPLYLPNITSGFDGNYNASGYGGSVSASASGSMNITYGIGFIGACVSAAISIIISIFFTAEIRKKI